MASHHTVIIGASAAGISFINKLTRLNPQAAITCISQEAELPYNKCFLADYLAGSKTEQETYLNTTSFAARVQFKLGMSVTQIDRNGQQILCSDGSRFSFDSLFIATGSSPYIPPFMDGVGHDGIFTFNSLADVNNIIAYQCKTGAQKVIIIGAGLSGIECADALHKNGLNIAIIEQKSSILHQFFDREVAAFLQARIETAGVNLLLGQQVITIDNSLHGKKKIFLASGSILDADIVILATGLKPNMSLAQKANLLVEKEGILVNEYMQTSDPNIYASGDVIATTNLLTGQRISSCTWPDAMLQGIYAAQAVAGMPQSYSGASLVVSSSFFGLHMAQAGHIYPQPDDTPIIKQGEGYYQAYLLNKGHLKGFGVLGNIHNLGILRKAILTGQQFDL